MEAKRDVGAVITPSGHSIAIPEGTPESIRHALEIAGSCQFCRFESDLIAAGQREYAIEARIGPARRALRSRELPWYRVRLLIPAQFPDQVVHIVPLDPALRWNAHQNGDWPLSADPHANVLCPPRLAEVRGEELLLPYLRHAYEWISAALQGTLTPPDQPYEFPHLVPLADQPIVVYAEGGRSIYAWARQAQCGVALLTHLPDRPTVDAELYRVQELRGAPGVAPAARWASTVQADAFGAEKVAGYACWAYAGPPVVGAPHRPPQRWTDLPTDVQRRVLIALQATARACVAANVPPVPLLLLAFAVPRLWGGQNEAVVWQAVVLQGLDLAILTPPAGFRREHPENWPAVKRFIAANETLRWIRACRDVARDALSSRRGATPNPLEGRRVAVIGTGALGAALAKAMVKLEPAALSLFDKGSLEPGNFVRHEASSHYAEFNKAIVMAAELAAIHTSTTVSGRRVDVIAEWEDVAAELATCDLVIDATGDFGVHERVANGARLLNACVAWCYLKPGPRFGVIALRRPSSSLTLSRAEAALRRTAPAGLWAAFEASDAREAGALVWPTPGCYDPTFEAPYHRVRMLADGMLTALLAWLTADDGADLATLLQQEQPTGVLGIEQRIAHQVRITAGSSHEHE